MLLISVILLGLCVIRCNCCELPNIKANCCEPARNILNRVQFLTRCSYETPGYIQHVLLVINIHRILRKRIEFRAAGPVDLSDAITKSVLFFEENQFFGHFLALSSQYSRSSESVRDVQCNKADVKSLFLLKKTSLLQVFTSYM